MISNDELYIEMYRSYADYLHELNADEREAEERRLLERMKKAALITAALDIIGRAPDIEPEPGDLGSLC
ncbi:hypothetical protein [Rhizobium sp. C1]|uniref:hypothetical protein n=1 Tax=Rhizobium sp. C1 TaxID=1349799 RepID=UPI001E3465A3|nr:hypothetical protein [Rhizobium sp. C1]MCD2177342.1 hypothetical protein [Rhizobium sp. C1]